MLKGSDTAGCESWCLPFEKSSMKSSEIHLLVWKWVPTSKCHFPESCDLCENVLCVCSQDSLIYGVSTWLISHKEGSMISHTFQRQTQLRAFKRHVTQSHSEIKSWLEKVKEQVRIKRGLTGVRLWGFISPSGRIDSFPPPLYTCSDVCVTQWTLIP